MVSIFCLCVCVFVSGFLNPKCVFRSIEDSKLPIKSEQNGLRWTTDLYRDYSLLLAPNMYKVG